MFIDASDILRGDFPAFPNPARLIGDFLEGDVGSNLERCNHIIALCHRAMEHAIDRTELTGNAFTLSILPDHIELFHQFLNEEQFPVQISVSIDQFLAVLGDWKRLIESHEAQKGTVDVLIGEQAKGPG
jgi:hypothetical protein